MLMTSRRDLLKFGFRALSAIGAGSVAGRLWQVNALAQTPACPSDYKALVCIFMFGGNDGNNTLIPVTTPISNPHNSYANYAAIRGGLALPQASLNMINTAKGDQYGLHPGLVELASLYNNKKNVAVLANVGTLVAPLTKVEYQGNQGSIPLNLFSHLDQQTEWQTSLAQGFATTGWGGRLADAMQSCNTGKLPIIVSVGGNALFATGSKTNPATVTAGQVLGLQGFNTSAASQARLTAVTNLMGFDNGLSLVGASNIIGSSGASQATVLSQALAGGKPLTTVFPNTTLGAQLQEVAKIINVRSALGMNRQIFFAYLGGFDTHDKELTDQATGLQTVSQAMNAFYNATVEMGVNQNVVTFTESDFGRTLQPSGGATLGTDHAWGSHHFIMGDAVKGGDLYGVFPTQELQGPDDANNRGVWIPQVSLDQYGATLATWFGANPAAVFPNLGNFTSAPPAFL
ncbi:conserved exported hypothetical protein [Candidatus Sulfopaludibacter sp. SbA4]|nr:conserved exported hypothetical protein [Candidatus Sulfopaludibacter sp. SbA4]